MAIPEGQLETWSHQGSITQSSDTYASVRNALLSSRTTLASRSTDVFLQGSYCNDTNVYRESDVDVVVQLTGSTFHHDLTALQPSEVTAFHQTYPTATYTYAEFRSEVLAALNLAFPGDVIDGHKAIQILASGNRRKADVLPALDFRRYYHFNGRYDASYERGLCFFAGGHRLVANYPKHHSQHLTEMHQAANRCFKPVVRIFKNMRNRLINDGVIEEGLAPSYYIEGLLYNVPPNHFSGSYNGIVFGTLKWLVETDRSQFVCANKQYDLFGNDSHVNWSPEKCTTFLNALVRLWNDW